jgi:hypothetical protein
MTRPTLLMIAVLLSAHVSSVARADKWPAPSPRIFAQTNGQYAFKVLPDAAALGTLGRKSEGVYFTLDERGQEKVIWRAKLVNIPHRVMLVQSAKAGKYARYVITIDTWARSGQEHCLVVYGDKGKVIADFKLEELLTAKEIESLPTTASGPHWSETDVAEFEDRSVQWDELVIRLKHKGWAKALRLTLSTGKIENA